MADGSLKSIKPIELVLDQSVSKQWVDLIGRLILDFGAIELLTYKWIHGLKKDERLLFESLDMTLKSRIDLIKKFISSLTIDKNLKDKVKAKWNKVKEISKLRNIIAHNPLIFVWKGKEEGPPDAIGIPKLRQLKKSSITQAISLIELQDSIDELARIVKELHQDLDSITKLI